MKKILSFVFVLFSFHCFACECTPISPITKELSAAYDVVFYGRVDSVSSCNTEKERAIAYFSIIELYKGTVAKQVKVNFDCSSECLMSFMNDDEWIIYARYTKFDYLNISICEHSRKKFNSGEQDIYVMDLKRTFEEEITFLKTSLGIQSFAQLTVLNNSASDTARHNTQPSGSGKIFLLLISLVVMVGIYFFTRKKK
jgi:hypothetical protein